MRCRIDSNFIHSLREHECIFRRLGLLDVADFTRQLGDLLSNDCCAQISLCQLPYNLGI